MTLDPKAVEAFHARPRRDNRIAEKWTPIEVEIEVSRLPMRPPLWDRMRRHQKITVLIAIRDGSLLILNDMGSGKTLVVYSLVHYYMAVEGATRFLVGVPNRINKEEWLDEGRKWFPDTKVVALPSSLPEKIAMLERSDAKVFIDTYGGLTRVVCGKRPKPKKKQGYELVIDPKVIKALANSFDGVVADESSFLGNHDSLQTRIFDKLSHDTHFFPMSGTPFGLDPTPLQPQMKMVDNGYTLGETLGLFRAAFFKETDGYWARKEYKFDHGKEKLLYQYLAHSSVRFLLNDADMPKVTVKPIIVHLPSEAGEYYNRARNVLKKAAISGDLRGTQASFNDLRAISSGFLPVKLEDGSRSFITFKENPKLDALMDALHTIGNYKFIVVHFFRHSGVILGEAMTKHKIKTVTINGGISTKDLNSRRDRFLRDPSVKGLLLAADAGAFGGNLQIAKYGFVYESPVPVITRKQVLRRFIRPEGEHDHVVLSDLIVKGTADERILEFHKTGANLFKAILKGTVAL